MPQLGRFWISLAVSAVIPGVAAAVELHGHYEGHFGGWWAGGIFAVLGILIVLGIFMVARLIIRVIRFGTRRLSGRDRASAADAPDTLHQTDPALATAAGGRRAEAVGAATTQPASTGVPATDKAQGGVDSDKILNLEKRVYRVERPLVWFGLIGSFSVAIFVILISTVVLFVSSKYGILAKISVPIFIYLIFLILGRLIVKIYQARTFSQDPTVKMNVVSKPIEILQYVITGSVVLVMFVTFAYAIGQQVVKTPDFLLTRDFFILTFGLFLLAGTGFLFWFSYSRTVRNPIINPSEIAAASVDPDEKIMLSIAGIARIGSFRDRGFNQNFLFFTPQSGRRMNPTAQNALLASKKRVYFIFVPMSLSDQTITNTKSLEWAFAQKYIQAKLDEMLKSMSLKEIYDSNPINFAINFPDIKNIIIKRTGFFNSQDIRFFDRYDRKLEIAVRNRPDLDKAKVFFRQAGLTVAER